MSRTELPPYLTDGGLTDLIRRALAEDVGEGDVTSAATVPEETTAEARFLAKADGVVAGLEAAARVFAAVDEALEVDWTVADGAGVSAGDVFGTVRGSARAILTAERLALNLLQRMSGIATATHRMVAAAAGRARILDTRKTAPGLRVLDKWAVKLGGGENHRIGLYDMILIKDNHIDAAGGLDVAVRAALRYRERVNPALQIEVETRTPDEVQAAINVGGVDVILLDNMLDVDADGRVDAGRLAAAVRRVGGRVQTEASGNVTLATVPAIAATGVDAISCGALTHSVQALDISLKISVAR